MVQHTILHTAEKSKRKRLQVDKRVYKSLRDTADHLNNVSSKGVVFSEIFLLTKTGRENYDDLDEYENIVNERLSQVTSDSLLKSVEEMKKQGDGCRSEVNEVFRHAWRSENSSEQADLNIHIPVSFDDQFAKYNFNRVAEQVLREYKDYPYIDRSDRIKCKRQIYEYVVNDNYDPDHRIASAVVNGASEIYDVGLCHEILNKHVDNWFEADSLTFPDIQSKQDSENALGQKDKNKKLEATYNAYKNSSIEEKEGLIKAISKTWDTSVRTAKNWIDEMCILYDISFGGEDKMDLQKTIDSRGLGKAIYYLADDKMTSEISEDKLHSILLDNTDVDNGQLIDALFDYEGEYWDIVSKDNADYINVVKYDLE